MIRLFLCVAIPISSAIKFNLGGAINPGEILTILIIPFLYDDILDVLRLRWVRIFLSGLAVYLASQIFSDIYRGSAPADFVRGWARIAMLTMSFIVIGALIGTNRKRILAFAVGANMAGFLALTLSRQDFDIGSTTTYKFIFGGMVAVASFLAAGYWRSKFPVGSTVAPFAGGVLSFLMNSRSLAGISLVSATIPYLIRFKTGEKRTFRLRTLMSLVLLAIIAAGIFQFYKVAAPNGILGRAAKEKYDAQVRESGDGKFSLLAGRKELHFSWPKIAQSPLIGWGSWPKDPTYVYNKMQELGVRPEVAAYEIASVRGLIPSHSHLFGAWLEGGLFAGLFWLITIVLVVRVLALDGFSFFGPLKPLLIYLFVNFAWNIPFSPFGGERRIYNGFLLWVLVLSLIYLSKYARSLRRAVPRPNQVSPPLSPSTRSLELPLH